MESHTAAKESKSACGPQIAQAALQSIGMSTRKFGNPLMGPPEYALAVSLIFTKATHQAILLREPPDHVCSTSILWSCLAHDKRFDQIPMCQASPGDILIEAGWQAAAHGYAGIVVDHGRIVSNSDKGVRDDGSLLETQRHHPDMAVFRYVGFRNYYRSKSLANAGYNSDEPRQPAGQPTGGEWMGESDISEAIQEKLWSRRNPKCRAAIAAVAQSHKGDKKWLKTGKYTNKCNIAVADWIHEAIGDTPVYKGRAPLAHEWADPNAKIEGWSAPFPVSQAQPGDVIAQSHEGGQFGHVGIVVGPGATASANALEHPAGIVTVNDWGFRPTAEANGGSPGDPMPVARRYIGY